MSSSITVGRYYIAHILISINVDDSSFNHILQYLILRLIHSLPGLNCLIQQIIAKHFAYVWLSEIWCPMAFNLAFNLLIQFIYFNLFYTVCTSSHRLPFKDRKYPNRKYT